MAWSSAFYSLWRVLLVYMSFWTVNWLNFDVLGAYLRTLVQCDSTGPHATAYCKEHPLDCVPHTPSDMDWSGSMFCFDKSQVLSEGTQIQSTFSSITTAVQCFAIPVLGAVADVHGRKKVLIMGLAVWTLLGACLSLANLSIAPLTWLPIGFIVVGFNCFDAVALSMAADSSDSDTRGAYMAAMFFCKQLAICVAFSFGYWVLAWNLTDYQNVWLVFTGFCAIFTLIAQLLVKETLGTVASNQQNGSTLEAMRMVRENLQVGLMVMWQDRFLTGLFLITLIAVGGVYGSIMITPSFLIGGFGYSQSTASIAGITQQPFVISGVVLAKHMMGHPKVGPHFTQIFGFVISTASFCLMGLSPLLAVVRQELPQVTWWLGLSLAGVSYGILDTSRSTLTSLRVREEHQAKVQGVMLLSYLLGQTLGQYLWGHFVSKPGTSGFALSVGFLYTSGLAVISLVSYICLYCFTKTLGSTALQGQVREARDLGLLTSSAKDGASVSVVAH